MPGADAAPGKSCSIAELNSTATGQALVPAVVEHDVHQCSSCCRWLLRPLHTTLHCCCFHSRCRNRSESNEATVLEITAGAGIWGHVESGHAAGSPGGSAASSPGGSAGNRCMEARNLACRMASGFVSGLVVDRRQNIAAPAAASIAPAVRAPSDSRNSCTAS